MGTKLIAKYRPSPGGDRCATDALRCYENLRAEGAKILPRVRARAVHYLRSRRRRAYRAGYDAGRDAAASEYAAKLAELHRRHEQLSAEARDVCVELAVAMTKAAVGERLSRGDDLLSSRLSREVQLLLGQTPLRISVNTAEYERIIGELSLVLPNCPVTVTASESVSPGDAIVETRAGSVELNLKTHLDALALRLREVWSDASGI